MLLQSFSYYPFPSQFISKFVQEPGQTCQLYYYYYYYYCYCYYYSYSYSYSSSSSSSYYYYYYSPTRLALGVLTCLEELVAAVRTPRFRGEAAEQPAEQPRGC